MKAITKSKAGTSPCGPDCNNHHETLVRDTARGFIQASGVSTSSPSSVPLPEQTPSSGNLTIPGRKKEAKLPDVCIRVKTHIKVGGYADLFLKL
jgi:hypothetical protein